MRLHLLLVALVTCALGVAQSNEALRGALEAIPEEVSVGIHLEEGSGRRQLTRTAEEIATDECADDPNPGVCKDDCLLAAATPELCILEHVKDYFAGEHGRCKQTCSDCANDPYEKKCEDDCALAAANPELCTREHVKDYFQGRCKITCLNSGRRQLANTAEEIGRRQLARTAEEIATDECADDPNPGVCKDDCLLAAATPELCILEHVKDYFAGEHGRCKQTCSDCANDPYEKKCEDDCALAAANPELCTREHVKDYFQGRCKITCLNSGRRQLANTAEEIGRRQLARTAEEIATDECADDPNPGVCEDDCLLAAATPELCILEHVKDYFQGRCEETCSDCANDPYEKKCKEDCALAAATPELCTREHVKDYFQGRCKITCLSTGRRELSARLLQN